MNGPILAGRAPAPTPPAPPVGDQPVVVGMRIVSAGGTVDLLHRPYSLKSASGLDGVDAPPTTESLAGVDGVLVAGLGGDSAGLTFAPARPILGVEVDAGSGLASRSAVAQLRHVLNVRRHGPAVLEVDLAGGTRSTMVVVHNEAAGDFSPPRGGGPVQLVVARMLGGGAVWDVADAGVARQAGPWVFGAQDGGETPADLPFDLAPAVLLGEAHQVRVAGTEQTWPVLDLVGPLGPTFVVSRGTGQDAVSYTVTGTLAAGETATVNHDPLAALAGGQIVGPGGVSWDDRVDDDGVLWPLRPGVEDVSVVVDGAQDGTSALLSWTPRRRSSLEPDPA